MNIIHMWSLKRSGIRINCGERIPAKWRNSSRSYAPHVENEILRIAQEAIANAMVAAEKWLASATPEQVAQAVPSQYAVADKAVFAKAYTNMRQCLSPDGLMAADAPKTVRAVLAAFDPSVAASNSARTRAASSGSAASTSRHAVTCP